MVDNSTNINKADNHLSVINGSTKINKMNNHLSMINSFTNINKTDSHLSVVNNSSNVNKRNTHLSMINRSFHQCQQNEQSSRNGIGLQLDVLINTNNRTGIFVFQQATNDHPWTKYFQLDTASTVAYIKQDAIIWNP